MSTDKPFAIDAPGAGLPEQPAEEALSGDSDRKSQPAFYQRRRKRTNEICQILIRHGAVKVEDVRKALRLQEEMGGQIGRILVRMRACSETAIARALLEQFQVQHAQGEVSLSVAARENPAIAGLKVQCSPFLTRLSLVLTDVTALLLGAVVGQLVNYAQRGALRLDGFLVTLPAVALCVGGFAVFGLYESMSPSPPDELRSTTHGVTITFLCGGAVSLLAQRGVHVWSLLAVFSWWAATVFAVPIARAILRAQCASSAWWGHPVVVLGAGQTGRLLVRTLRAQPGFGLKPVMMLDDDRSKHGTLRADLHAEGLEVRSVTQATSDLVSASLRGAGVDLVSDSLRVKTSELFESTRSLSRAAVNKALQSESQRQKTADLLEELASKRAERPRGRFAEVEGVPVVGDFALAPLLAKRLKIPYAIVALPNLGSQKLLHLTERVGGMFSHLLLIPDLFGFASLGVPARDVGGILGIEVRQQLLLPGPRLVKRIMDVVLTAVGGLFILPLIGLLALLIKLDSKGPVFYFQERLGRDGKPFRAAKFRSMHGDGEARLAAVLAADPKLKAEYEEFHKLNDDPRVTRVGRVVRKYSLDELPQLWSVIKGEMSLVGPRPYLEREVPEMDQREGIILRATPGLTGLWQVSDRNSTGFAVRVKMDVHYVRNWSPWLDIYILARTVGVVLKGTGY